MNERVNAMLEVIVNPVSGNGQARRILDQVERELSSRGIAFHTSQTTAQGHAAALTREAIARGADSMAVLGGDGLLSEVCSQVAGGPVRLLFVPCGTGNDFIKTLRLPKDPLKALRLQLDNPNRRIDCGALNGLPFINVAGAGLDTDVLAHAEAHKSLPFGMLPYLIGVVKALGGFRPIECEVSIDGVTEHRRYTIISVANGRFIGGGMKAAPLADVTDGLLDVMLVDAMPKWQLWLAAPLFLTGLHTKLPFTRRVPAKAACIKCQRPFWVDVDGELKQVADAQFEVLPRALTISCPQ